MARGRNKHSLPTSVQIPLLSVEDEENAIEEEKTQSSVSSTSHAWRADENYDFSHGDGLREEYEEKISVELRSPISSTSPTPWSSSATAPLLSDTDEHAVDEGEKTADVPQEEEKPSFSGAEYQIAFSHFVRIFSYATRNDKLVLFAAIAASVCTGITLPIMNVVFGELVGAFSAFYNPESGETKEEFTQIINKNVTYLVYLFLARLFLDYIAMLGFRMASIRISAAMRLAYLQALFKQPISVLDTLPPGQTAAIITVTANTLQIGISEKLSTLIQSISLIITALIVAFYYNWILTLVTSSGLVFIVVFYGVTIPFLVGMLKEVEHADRMSASIASEAFGAIRMVAACEAEGKIARRYAGWVKESRRRGLLMSPLVAIQQSPVFFAIHATFALSFWYAIKLYTEYKITNVATIIIVLMSIMTIVMSIGSVAGPVTAAAQAAGAAAILFTIIDAPQPQTTGFKAPNISSQEDIVLENVSFAYPVQPGVKVLDNLNVRFPAGKMTAICGASGAGKSTIVGLLERWYELDDAPMAQYFRNGTIKIGGRNLHEIDLKWWRSQIGLVQQEPFLFNDTISKNVEFGMIGTNLEHVSEERKMKLVRQACKEAFADEFIVRLPEGYNTIVGDAGIKLSGGQRQRLAIARSIVKQPNILILDEATSSIDVRGERIVQAALDKVSRNRTTITIAHRLSTIMKADNIVVLDKGGVVQQGTHEELMNHVDGPYWSLANAQQLSTGEDVTTNEDILDPEKKDILPPKSNNFEADQKDIDYFRMRAATTNFTSTFVQFLWEQRLQWKWYTLMLWGALGAGAAFPLHAFLFAKLISLFNLWGLELYEQTNFWCLMFTLLATAVGISYFVLGWSSNTVSFNITATYRQEYFQNILSKPISYYDNEESSLGSLISRISNDPAQLQQLLGINMAIVLISMFNIAGSISISFFFGWKLTLVTVCSAMPIILAAGFFRIRHETQFEKMNNEVFAESSKFASESIGAFRTVSSLILEREIIGRYEILLKSHARNAFHRARFSTLVFAMSDSISLLCMAFVLWYGGRLLASYEYSPFNYLVIYLAVVQGSTSAGQSMSFGPNIANAFAAAKRIRNMRPESNFDSEETSIPFNIDDACDEKEVQGARIELRNIWFKYPTRDVMVLKGLDMIIEKGQFAAIVGSSGIYSAFQVLENKLLKTIGCGKTSIISLLERFYQAQEGHVLLHDTNIRNISMSEYRKSISLVAQEASLFQGSMRQNILLGVDEFATSDETLYQACRDAEIHDFITSLPEGYDTAVGAKGVALSGGQRQRIAIARALIRNPRVLLLDEATSNLDSQTEKSIQSMLERTGKGRTMVVVAHRLATVQNADVIFVMSEGNVVETGNHSSLLRRKGIYYQMCQSQALDK